MEKAIPKVIPVRDPEKQPSKQAEIHPHLPQIEGFGGGALCLLVSPVRTGKSTLISNMLLNENFYDAQERFDTTTIISNTIANDITSRFLRKAFDTPENPFLPDNVLWRQKEQFSDGVGYGWIDGIRDFCDKEITDNMLKNSAAFNCLNA